MRKLKLYEAKVYLTDGTELWMSTQASSKEEAIERFHEEPEDEWIGPRDIDYIEIKEAQPDRVDDLRCLYKMIQELKERVEDLEKEIRELREGETDDP